MSLPRVALTAALCAVCWMAPDARALTGASAVAALNAQRSQSGIPGDLVERTDWTAACKAHNRYMELNNVFVPSEDAGKRGYSTQGAWAAPNSVLGRDTWTPQHNPWENAPLGLMPLLSPRLTVLGASASYHHVCATTRPGYLRPAPSQPSLYSYPGDGAAGVPYRQWSFGVPFTPGDFVGLPAGFTTGPLLYVLADVDGTAKMEGASLIGPSGPVEIRTVDNTVADLGGFLAPGGIIIPTGPLEPGSAYRASAVMTIAGLTLARAWTFITGLADPNTQLFVSSALTYDTSAQPPRISQGSIGVRSSSAAPIHVSVAAGGVEAGSHDLLAGETWIPPQTPGDFSVCAHQEPTSYYRGYDRCLPLHIRDKASFLHPTVIELKASIAGRMVRYKFAVHPPRGRKVTFSARRFAKGRWKTFRTVRWDANRWITRTITARDTDQAVQVVASVPKVRLGPEVYRAARVVKTIRR